MQPLGVSLKTKGVREKSAKEADVRWVCDTTGNLYRGADKSLARPISRCILFDGENNSFDASLVIYTVFARVICAPAYFAHPNF